MTSSARRGKVDAGHRRDEGELRHDVAGTRAVERVLRGLGETELARDERRFEAEARSGERATPVRRDGCPHRPVAQTLKLPHEGPRVGEQVVREQDGLRVLQVGAPRHDRLGMRLGLGHERVDDAEEIARDDAGV